jgi:hypothetical protein
MHAGRQNRKPCSGRGFARMIASREATVDEPIFSPAAGGAPASAMRARHVFGDVVWRRFAPEGGWLVMRLR